MKKAASIFLRADIKMSDVDNLINWMEKPNVARYLNESPYIVRDLKQVSGSVPEPMLTYHFNRMGHFFMVCPEQGFSIGFVKLMPAYERNVYEIVFAIGDEDLWGNGFGKCAIRSALAKAFLELRAVRVIAKIMPMNKRSIRSVCSCGFSSCGENEHYIKYEITSNTYLERQKKS